MNLSWLSSRDPALVAGLLFAAMLLAAEAAYFVGRWRRPKSDEAGRGHFGVVQGSLLGLLALLLAFNLSLATQRFDARRQLVLEDANIIWELFRQSSLMPPPVDKPFQDLLRQYVNQLVAMSQAIGDPSPQRRREMIGTLYNLEHRIWDVVRTEARRNLPTPGAPDLAQSLIRFFSIQRSRLAAHLDRVPDPVVWLLLVTSIVTSGTIGYSGGLDAQRGLAAKVLMAALVAGTIMVMLALDRPRGYLLQVSQWPIVQVQWMLNHQPVEEIPGASR